MSSGEQWAVLGGVVGGIWLLLLWIGIVVWTYRDVRERTRDVTSQVLSVFLVLAFFPGFNLPGLMLYLIMRPKETLEEEYARSLEEEALLREIGEEISCPSCRRFVEKDFLLCPYCQTQLKDNCPNCSKALRFNWIACPYCGTPRHARPRPARAGQTAALDEMENIEETADLETGKPTFRKRPARASQNYPD